MFLSQRIIDFRMKNISHQKENISKLNGITYIIATIHWELTKCKDVLETMSFIIPHKEAYGLGCYYNHVTKDEAIVA